MFKKKKIEPKCKNCKLFDSKEKRCLITVLHGGEKFNLPVDEEDDCFFEGVFEAISPEGIKEQFKPDIKEVKLWVEDPITGEKSDHGIVRIEYPVGFFGEDNPVKE